MRLWRRKLVLAVAIYSAFVVLQQEAGYGPQSWLHSMALVFIGLCASYALVAVLMFGALWATGELPKKWRW